MKERMPKAPDPSKEDPTQQEFRKKLRKLIEGMPKEPLP